eukprot:646882-Lingulodinium_polyedra.AAC.1
MVTVRHLRTATNKAKLKGQGALALHEAMVTPSLLHHAHVLLDIRDTDWQPTVRCWLASVRSL